MNLELINKFFPAPNFLVRLGVGLDISDRSIKFLEVTKVAGRYYLGRHGEVALPVGALVRGEIAKPEEFKKVLTELKDKYNFKHVFISLPDEPSYVFNVSLPELAGEEIRSAIELQIEEHVPLPAEELNFDFDLIRSDKESGQDLFGVVAIPKKIIASYEQVFAEVGLNLLAIENQGSALARALLSPQDTSNSVIVDLGRTHTAVYWVSGGVVIHSAAAPVGGEAITHNIEKALGISFAEAEQLKMRGGLSRSEANRPVFEAMIPVLGAIRDEIFRFTTYWLNKSGDQTRVFDKIILIGGQSSLPGLPEYLANNLDCTVELANPWVKFFPAGYKPSLSLEEALRFGTVLGLALRNYL